MKLKKKVCLQENAVDYDPGYQVPEPQYRVAMDKKNLLDDDNPKRNLRIPSGVIYGGIMVLFAVIVPTVIYITVFTDNANFQSAMWTCILKTEYRVPCLKGQVNVNDDICTRIGCCWNETDKMCFHSLPSQHSYAVKSWVDNNSARDQLCTNYLDLTSREQISPYGSEAANQLRAIAVPVTHAHLRIFIYNTSAGEPILPERLDLSNTSFQISVYGPHYFSMEISRREDKKLKLFSTSRGPLIASKNSYWELTLQFPRDSKVFGLGELELSSKPKVLYNNEQRTGANPFIMVLSDDGKAHGVHFNNSGPMEFQLLSGSNLLIVRSLSTLNWDLSVFAGPTPKDVMQQFTMERRPMLPPQWALGLHVCRDTDGNTTLDYVNAFINVSLPYESDCIQETLLGGLNFTIPPTLLPAISILEDAGKKLLISLQPQVQSSLADKTELFVMKETGPDLEENYYRNKTVHFPDFFHNDARNWLNNKLRDSLQNQIQEELQGLQVKDFLGGYVLQEDWPRVNNTQDNIIETMDYVPDDSLSDGTLSWMTRHGEMPHYLIHNEYGLQFASSLSISPDQVILSTSTYTGSGAVGGSHVHSRAQVDCTWDNMATALKVALGLGLSGIPLAGGGPVCGNYGKFNDELCLRWYLMSSMLPLMRVSSEEPLRDPVNIESFKTTISEAIQRRYSLISYFYSLFVEASTTGVPVARPMFFEFPADNNTWDKYDHFMVGPALLVRPMFLPNQVSVQVYLPKEDIPWYHLLGGHKVNNGTGGYEIGITSMPTELVVLIRGGYIIPLQEQIGLSVADTVNTLYTLVVALNCIEDGNCTAIGDLKTNQHTLYFTSSESGLIVESTGTCEGQFSPSLEYLTIYGLNTTGSSEAVVTVTPYSCGNSKSITLIEDHNYVLRLKHLQVDLCCREVFINWILT